jgi:SsrA-binding protein
MSQSALIQNRKARYNFHLLECYEAGIALVGTEIKALREGRANLQDGYCFFHRGELLVKNMHITGYQQAYFFNHEPKRTRKLLMKKSELRKLRAQIEEKGKTIVPTKLYINKRGLAKVEVCLAKGKQAPDKRQAIKEREQKREVNRQLKNFK